MSLVYDLGKYPASWDFLQWLVNARIAVHNARFDVCFVPGPEGGFRKDNIDRPLDARKAILKNVMRPALRLVGAQEAEAGEIIPLNYAIRYAVEFAKRGLAIPPFDIPQEFVAEVAADYRNRSPLVITLRETNYYPARNSNLKAWKDFARRSKQDCIFVRDTANADEPIEGFENCPRAAKDFLYRAALMRHARCNLLVANGPWMLALYSPTPWLMFGAIRPEMSGLAPGRPGMVGQTMSACRSAASSHGPQRSNASSGATIRSPTSKTAWERLSHQ